MALAHPLPDLSALDLLISIKKEGSISKAALAHHISQPAASMKIKILEDVLGINLIQRSASGTHLTENGVLIGSIAEEVTEKIYELKELADTLRGSHRSELRISSSMTVAEYLVPNWIHQLHLNLAGSSKEIPFVKLSIKNSRDVIEEIRSGSAEVGFIENDTSPKDLISKVIFEDELVIIASPSHHLVKRNKPISINALRNIKICSREEGSGTREVLEKVLESYDIPIENMIEMGSTTAIKSAVELGTGVGVLSKLAVQSELQLATLKIIELSDIKLTRKIHAIWKKTDTLSESSKELIKICMQH